VPSEAAERQEYTVSQHSNPCSAQLSSRFETLARSKRQPVRIETSGTDLSKPSTIQLRWEKEVESLLAKNIELQEKNRRLGDLLQLAESAQLLRGQASKDPQEGLIQTHIAMIYEQQQKIKSLQEQVPKLKRITTQPLALPPGKLDGTMRTLVAEIESMLHGTNCFQLQVPLVPKGSDLETLLRTFQIDTNQKSTLESYLENCVAEYGLPATVRTIALAALRDWVFASDFPNDGGNGTSSALLSAYRDIIYDLGTLSHWSVYLQIPCADMGEVTGKLSEIMMLLPVLKCWTANNSAK